MKYPNLRVLRGSCRSRRLQILKNRAQGIPTHQKKRPKRAMLATGMCSASQHLMSGWECKRSTGCNVMTPSNSDSSRIGTHRIISKKLDMSSGHRASCVRQITGTLWSSNARTLGHGVKSAKFSLSDSLTSAGPSSWHASAYYRAITST